MACPAFTQRFSGADISSRVSIDISESTRNTFTSERSSWASPLALDPKSSTLKSFGPNAFVNPSTNSVSVCSDDFFLINHIYQPPEAPPPPEEPPPKPPNPPPPPPNPPPNPPPE